MFFNQCSRIQSILKIWIAKIEIKEVLKHISTRHECNNMLTQHILIHISTQHERNNMLTQHILGNYLIDDLQLQNIIAIS
jgi:hypothetical protein